MTDIAPSDSGSRTEFRSAQAGISLAARNALALPGDGASAGLDRQRCGLPDGCFHLSDIRVTDRYSDRPEACDSGRQFYLSRGLPHVARHKPGAHRMHDRTGVRLGRGSRSPHRSLESPRKARRRSRKRKRRRRRFRPRETRQPAAAPKPNDSLQDALARNAREIQALKEQYARDMEQQRKRAELQQRQIEILQQTANLLAEQLKKQAAAPVSSQAIEKLEHEDGAARVAGAAGCPPRPGARQRDRQPTRETRQRDPQRPAAARATQRAFRRQLHE